MITGQKDRTEKKKRKGRYSETNRENTGEQSATESLPDPQADAGTVTEDDKNPDHGSIDSVLNSVFDWLPDSHSTQNQQENVVSQPHIPPNPFTPFAAPTYPPAVPHHNLYNPPWAYPQALTDPSAYPFGHPLGNPFANPFVPPPMVGLHPSQQGTNGHTNQQFSTSYFSTTHTNDSGLHGGNGVTRSSQTFHSTSTVVNAPTDPGKLLLNQDTSDETK